MGEQEDEGGEDLEEERLGKGGCGGRFCKLRRPTR